jgi:E3 ubiquitin-protein ligase mind-bomb
LLLVFQKVNQLKIFFFFSATKLILKKLIEQQKLWLINERKDDGFTALHLACLNNHYEVAKLLIDVGGADLSIKTLNQQTPLLLAIERQHFDIIKLLVERKSNLNDQNKDGDTALHCLLRNFNLIQLKHIYMQDANSNKVENNL